MAKVHQEVTFAGAPAKVYAALMNSAEHAKFTGAPAQIGANAGDAWSAYEGKISGLHIEVVAGVRVVQSWRPGSWPEGVHSLVKFEFQRDGSGTKLVLDHDALPDDEAAHIDIGWERMYWAPLRKYLAA